MGLCGGTTQSPRIMTSTACRLKPEIPPSSEPLRRGSLGRAATFRQSDVERVIKTLQRTGLGVSKVLVENGRVIVLPLTAPEPEAHPDAANAWDDLLSDDKA